MTTANQIKGKQHVEPMKTLSKNKQTDRNAGKEL